MVASVAGRWMITVVGGVLMVYAHHAAGYVCIVLANEIARTNLLDIAPAKSHYKCATYHSFIRFL